MLIDNLIILKFAYHELGYLLLKNGGSLHADKFVSFDKKFHNKALALNSGVIFIES